MVSKLMEEHEDIIENRIGLVSLTNVNSDFRLQDDDRFRFMGSSWEELKIFLQPRN